MLSQIIPSTLDPFLQTPVNSNPIAIGDRYGVPYISEAHDTYYQQAVRGNVFHAFRSSSPSATIPVANTGTAVTFALFNPTTSGVIMVPLRYTIHLAAQASTKNIVFHSLWQAPSVGDRAGTGSGLLQSYSRLTFASVLQGQITNGFVGSGKVNKGWALHTATVTASLAGRTPPQAFSMGNINLLGTDTPWAQMWLDFDDTVIILPGGIMWDAMVSITGPSVARSWSWYEVPL